MSYHYHGDYDDHKTLSHEPISSQTDHHDKYNDYSLSITISSNNIVQSANIIYKKFPQQNIKYIKLSQPMNLILKFPCSMIECSSLVNH